jgi:hypothetical protein
MVSLVSFTIISFSAVHTSVILFRIEVIPIEIWNCHKPYILEPNMFIIMKIYILAENSLFDTEHILTSLAWELLIFV